MLPTPQVSQTPESLVLTLLEILGCLPFQESVVLNYAVCMSGVELVLMQGSEEVDPAERRTNFCTVQSC